MLSAVLFIASAIAIIVGIAIFVHRYAPYVADLWNNAFDAIENIKNLLPDWLLPFAGVAVALALIGLLVKLL